MFLGLLLVAIAGTCAHAQNRPRWPDGITLLDLADSARIDGRATLAMAWQESGDNLSTRLRGHHCWYSQRVVRGDSVVVLHHHESDCEVGRYQIKPSTARLRCPGLNIFTYAGNTRCFAKMFAEDTARRGIEFAITNHNGRGPRARAYLARVLAMIGWITVVYQEQT